MILKIIDYILLQTDISILHIYIYIYIYICMSCSKFNGKIRTQKRKSSRDFHLAPFPAIRSNGASGKAGLFGHCDAMKRSKTPTLHFLCAQLKGKQFEYKNHFGMMRSS